MFFLYIFEVRGFMDFLRDSLRRGRCFLNWIMILESKGSVSNGFKVNWRY